MTLNSFGCSPIFPWVMMRVCLLPNRERCLYYGPTIRTMTFYEKDILSLSPLSKQKSNKERNKETGKKAQTSIRVSDSCVHSLVSFLSLSLSHAFSLIPA